MGERYSSKKAVFSVSAILLGIIGSSFFLSSNITGSTIGDISESSSSIIGVALFFLAVAVAVYFLRNENSDEG